MLACSTLPHSGHGYVGPAEVLVVDKSRFANSALFLSLRDHLFVSAVLAPV